MNVLRWIVDRFPLGGEDDDEDQANAAREEDRYRHPRRGRVGRVRHGQGGPTR
ncbi:MAG: hypothetical protein QOK26_3120 [Pseudonocardiales bacterium]|jgi:hypothetical protein|nr:hypothetical protein [Pseudonocardiales bacterium]MDT7561391.1 hypothetical protein [Pseudonocardiales bacterium]MDT7582669.1 hypothetical protein [Pseudonocardiales bacterium]MDT7601043.1 hypothetical protein [Pseudonocardiales bacterium]MDT7696999.1 hypothetical protein [Pseudonocardiales bacterium]